MYYEVNSVLSSVDIICTKVFYKYTQAGGDKTILEEKVHSTTLVSCLERSIEYLMNSR